MEVTVRLARDQNQPLGIGFRRLTTPPYCQVAKLIDHGAASDSGLVQEGDTLLGINNRDVQHLSPKEISEMLGTLASDPTITFHLHRNVMNSGQADLLNGPPQIVKQGASPESSPSPRRTRRAGVTAGVMDSRLPGILEQERFTLGIAPEKRRSLTPETTRKHLKPLTISKSIDLGNLPQLGRHLQSVVPLKNLIDGTELSDRLHNQCQDQKFKETGCHPTHCLGSHMWPRDHRKRRPYAAPRTKEEMLPLAEDFIKQYYESKRHALGNNYEEQLDARLATVRGEIEEKGHYDLTYEELVFGARTAWRNAPRCINRIIWRQLEVLDARDVNTPKEMFDAICHHIKYSFNGGNIRSSITVFHHRTKPKSDFRVWNSQLFRYAGYKQADGSILGDPANVELTEVCMQMGWHPQDHCRTAFDTLPLILQAHGGDPQLFEIPKELSTDVKITHPEYEWFEELGLRWYGLPAVSAMMLDVGGLEFTGTPFSGWYMSSEIARDFADVSRYNMLKPIAQRMGLNVQSYKLWKDKAFMELNVAALHSFQKANVSVVDHHSATESFMTHIKAETQTRGGCPADWVWLVPPISGSTTPVFHQEMLLYHLTPSYEYQDDPWNHYHLPRAHGRATRSGSLSFKTVARLVGAAAQMTKKAYAKRIKATILYATETGRSRNYAHIVSDIFGRVFATKVVCMEEYNRANLEHEQLLVVVTSTFGSGDPPANGELFGRYLLDLRNGTVQPGVPTLPRPRGRGRMSTVVAPSREMLEGKKDTSHLLTQVKYAVFGLGSRAYPNFCTYAHTCDNLMKDLGAEQIFQCGEGDELCGQEESFQSWLRGCYLQACEIYKLDPRLEVGDSFGYKPGYSKENYRVKQYSGPVPEKNICRDLCKVHKKDIFPAVLKSRTKLQSPQSDRSTILAVLDAAGTRLRHEPGDHVAIYPQNNAKLVSELLERLNFSCTPDEPFVVESRRESPAGIVTWVEEQRLPIPVTLREAFTYYLDITSPPTPQLLKLLAQQATKLTDQEDLNDLAKGGDLYEDWKYDRFPNLMDVINQFHSLKVDVTLLLQQLPLLQCRYYSISSSPRVHFQEVHTTIAIVSFRKRGGLGPKHFGVCSTWLNRLEPGSTVPCFIRKALMFRMPDDPLASIIMVGPGTGIAPFRSFWQERMHKKNEALKLQLSLPSNVEQSVQQLSLKPPEAQPQRKRRVTAFSRPNPNLLQPQSESVHTSPAGTPLPIRRSASDAEDTEHIAKILAARQKVWGSMTLYFGCRRSNQDHIYKEELRKAHISGALSDIHVGLSREPNQPKTYVQHLLKKNAETVVRQLIEEKGHFYVCGDISMAADVCRTLQTILEDNAVMSSEQARKHIEQMKDDGFYHEDIFGVTLKTAEVTSRVRSAAKKRAWRILVTAGASTPLSPATPSMLRGIASPMSPMPAPFPSGAKKESTLTPHSHVASLPKRPTVTVLLPTPPPTETKPAPQLFRPSAPAFAVDRQRKWKEHSSTSFEEESMSPPPEDGVKLITYEEQQVNILEPLAETKEEEEEEKEGEVKKRNMSKEKKRIRRIKTNSKVETVV